MSNKILVGFMAVLMLAIVGPGFYMGYALKSRTTPLMSTVGSLGMLPAADNAPAPAETPDSTAADVVADLKPAADVETSHASMVLTSYAARTETAIAPVQNRSDVVPTTQAP